MIGKVNFSYSIYKFEPIEVNFTLFLLVKTPENCQKKDFNQFKFCTWQLKFTLVEEKNDWTFLLDKTNKQTNIPLDLLYI